jgi:hypothetical protein
VHGMILTKLITRNLSRLPGCRNPWCMPHEMRIGNCEKSGIYDR